MKKGNPSQERIIDYFRKLAKEIDIQQTTSQHLAKCLDIKASLPYSHFKNICDVETALAAKLLQGLNDQLHRVLVGKSGQEALQIYAETYRFFAFSNQAVYELLISVPHINETALLEGIHETNQIILQIFETFQLTEREKIHRSRELHSVVHSYLSLRFLGYFTKEPTINPEDNYFWMISDFTATLL